jgi:hypothetical protein
MNFVCDAGEDMSCVDCLIGGTCNNDGVCDLIEIFDMTCVDCYP